MAKPRIVKLSAERFKKRFGSGEAAAKGNTIYVKPSTSRITLEHEKAHIQLGHTKPYRLNAYQFATRELKAEKIAHEKVHRKIGGHSLKITAEQADEIFGKALGKHPTKAEKAELKHRVDKAVNNAAEKLGIPYRIV